MGGLILPHLQGAEGSGLQPAGAWGDQRYHNGREGLDSLSAAAPRLLAVTRLSRAQLLLGSTAARATLSRAGAVTATLALGDRAMVHLEGLVGLIVLVPQQHKMERGSAGGGPAAALH